MEETKWNMLCADTDGLVLPGEQKLICLMPGGAGRLLGSWFWRTEDGSCETGGEEAWLSCSEEGLNA